MTGHEDTFGSEGVKFTILVMVNFLQCTYMSTFTQQDMLGVTAYVCYTSIKLSPFSIPHIPSGLSPELSFSMFCHLVVLCARLSLISSC